MCVCVCVCVCGIIWQPIITKTCFVEHDRTLFIYSF